MVYIGVSEGVIVVITSDTSSARPIWLYVENKAMMYSFHQFELGLSFPARQKNLCDIIKITSQL